ncbi:hypothetical protein GCM10010232_48660 [Streptomyces amakusaensis]|uniref:DUF397 domain-containing protein n=1 Tax=Streptomyces amakusaensis TaxID=67271 RepID=A0ABW0AM56_9ACTN
MTHHPKPDPADLDLTQVAWVVSSHSGGGGDCVMMGTAAGHVLIGDTKNPTHTPLVVTSPKIRSFLRSVREGQFDRRTQTG